MYNKVYLERSEYDIILGEVMNIKQRGPKFAFGAAPVQFK